MTENSINAINNLRNVNNFNWSIVPLLVFIIYIYVNEFNRKKYDIILISVSTFFAELIWEMFNALILHFTNYAPLWSTPGKTVYLLYVGYNLEIALFFSIASIILLNSLPIDKNKKIFGLSNRKIIPFFWGLVCVFIEIILYFIGLLKWDYFWWRWPHIYLIAFVYIFPWFLVVNTYDKLSLNKKISGTIIITLSAIILHILFVVIFKWI